MKDWFPLASYDFYAFLAAGMLVLGAVDRVFFGSMLAAQADWTFISGVFWVAVAYLTGHIVAIPSSALLEQVLARRVLGSPASIILGIRTYGWAERVVAALFGAREYQPFPAQNRERILAKIADGLGVAKENVDAEAAFQHAFPHARSVADTAGRLDNFINQYGMCRNVSFASAFAAALLATQLGENSNAVDVALLVGAIILSLGMFGRFIKFYAAYSREVFRTYAIIKPTETASALSAEKRI